MAEVMGTGLLAEEITIALKDRDGREEVTITACDGWARGPRRDGAAWLPVWVEYGVAVIGPLRRPGEPGCLTCFETRRNRVRTDSADRAAVLAVHGPELAERASPYLGRLAARTIAALAAHAAEGPGCAVWYVDLHTLTAERHTFLPEPHCPDCGGLPDDDRASAVFEPGAAPRPPGYRVRDVPAEHGALLDTYVDGECGLIRPLVRDTLGGLVIAGAMLPLRFEGGSEPGVGRTRGYRASEVTAVLEALERWGGVEPGGKRTRVRASYAEVAADALDPRTLGEHDTSSYGREGFAFRPFTEDAVCDWVWGYSFGRRAPILVPESLAYYYVRGRERPFLFEISNGCALGGSMAEALLYGLLETVERDAFLMTWYGRLPVPRIDPVTARDRTIPLQAAAITAETGYRVELYDTTMEHGVPSVWAMGVRQDGDPGRPRMVCAAGAHLVPEKAVLGALSELGPLLADLIRRYPDEVHRAQEMVANPDLVATMHDHSTLYGADAAFDRLSFLTEGTAVRRLPDMEAFTVPGDLDVTRVVDRFLAEGMDVVVIDQTTPEHRACGFSCVKVLVPGTLPMTFGHRNRRVRGLTRPLELPYRLGHRTAPLTPADLNPDPHPFP
ncbi:TOMM precursor leader peptide-binding protein [Nonomuraea sp. NPDC051941]|uniref:TOMM precursor leader peptide-binding protein n=1 Tax=Nonomuraea sp. NPDC051941 TaxID=3364373 RepID=UPI0037CB5E1A